MNGEIIAKYLSGNCSEKDCEDLLAWVDQSEANKQLFSDMKNAWTISHISAPLANNQDQTTDFNRIYEKIKAIDGNEIKPSNKFKEALINFRKLAAAVIITIGITAFISYLVWNRPAPAVSYHQLMVPSGQQAQLTLPDGTKIWLNSKSKLTYPGSFPNKLREVVLEGEGYFQVSHNPRQPFVVKTSHLNIKVLGTSFNVTSYKDENKIMLALVTGSVSITEEGSEKEVARVKPHELATYSKTDKGISLQKVETGLYTSWLKGQFKFRNLSFEDISRRLGRNFNVNFIFLNQDVKQLRYNGSFYNYESLSQILKIMQTNSPFKFKINKNQVFIE